MDWDTQYLEWCEIMQMNKSRRDQIVFMAGMTWQSLASGAIRAEALKDASERAKKWILDPEPGFSLLTAILSGEVKE